MILDSLCSNCCCCCYFVIPIVIFITIYYYIRHLYKYWELRGMNYIKPTIVLGNFGQNTLQKLSFPENAQELYKQSINQSYIGIYMGFKPTLLINDPTLIQTILIKDFHHFHERGDFFDIENDPLAGNLFSLTGEKWKHLRQKLTPLFTSGKLRAMFQTVIDCGRPLQHFMDDAAKRQCVIDVREITAQYTTNIIASVAFGLEINCFDNPNTDFQKYGKKALEMSAFNVFKIMLTSSFPVLRKFIKAKSTPDDVEKYVMTLVRDTLNQRESENISRQDFFQLLIQIKNENMEPLTFYELAAQAWVFYLAGFETSATVMAFCLYELAKNMDCQKKVQNEIDEILQKNNGNITYDCVNDMKYLENCIDETLRKYPPAGVIQRECSKDYRIPDTEHTIEKCTAILIPLLALHMDDKYHPEPEAFKPERFCPENQKSFIEMPFMPFGEGPRSCIGTRMGKMQTKAGLILMLQKYWYELAGNTLTKPIIDPKSFLTKSVGGIELKVTARTN